MVRIVILLGVAILVFCGTLLGAAILNGNVSQADLDKLFGRETEAPAEQAPMIDELNTTARLLRDKEESLNARAQELDEREKRLLQQAAENQKLLEQNQQILEQINEGLEKADEEQQANIKTIAESMTSMDAPAAAAALAALLKDKPDVAVEVVKQIPTRQRGELLSSLDPDDSRTLFLQLQEPTY